MAKTVNASVTDGQINEMVAKFRAAMEKNREEIDSVTFQQIQGIPNIGMKFFAVVRECAEKISEQIVRLVENINRAQTNSDAVIATKCSLCGDIDHVEYLPKGEGDSEKITFVPLEKDMSPDEVDALVANDGWRYATFKGLCKHNQDNPDFSKNTPHFIQGKDEKGRHCYAAFDRCGGARLVSVFRSGLDWGDHWSVAVVPASPEGLET
ncbi:MAG: hypothetical protein ACI92I_000160 [Acidimicrobiales bacterium]|jgi:hypothetical protein